MVDFAIVEVEPDRLESLQPIWRSLYEHHLALTPHLHDRMHSTEEAWAARRRVEGEWLAEEPQSFVLAAESAGRYLGYAFVRVRSAAGFATSWSASDPLAELSILAVLPEARGGGVGSALLDATEARLREIGVQDMLIGVVTTNVEAMRLYERRGAVPFVTEYVQRIRSPSAG